MPTLDRPLDRYLKHLTFDPAQRVYRCEALDAWVWRESHGWSINVPTKRDVYIALDGTILEMDNFIGAVLATPLPHTKLRKATPGPYAYDPWRMAIRIAEHNPGWGNTFKGGYRMANGHHDLYLGRLKNLRAFLAHVKEMQIA